jgi:DNA-binding IclR family transcriptional regulator
MPGLIERGPRARAAGSRRIGGLHSRSSKADAAVRTVLFILISFDTIRLTSTRSDRRRDHVYPYYGDLSSPFFNVLTKFRSFVVDRRAQAIHNVDTMRDRPILGEKNQSGTQSIERAMGVIRSVAEAGVHGVRLMDLVDATKLKQPTVSRLIAALMRGGLIEQDAETRRFYLGVEAFALGAIASARFGIHKLALDALLHLATATEDSAFLSIPRDTVSICLHGEEGAFPIRTQVLKAGDRYPLGVGAGSLAILAAMPDPKVEQVIAKNVAWVAKAYPAYSADRLRQLVAETRTAGFAVNKGLIVSGSWGVGVAIIGDDRRPAGALSVAAIEARLPERRRLEVARLLQAAASDLSSRLRQLNSVSRLGARSTRLSERVDSAGGRKRRQADERS